MITDLEDVYQSFFDKVGKDEKFFDYYNLTKSQAMSLATDRADSFFKEAVTKIMLLGTPDVNLFDYDLDMGVLNVPITYTEAELIASFMFEVYVSRDIAMLKVYEVNFSPSDLKVFSPSNSRKTFMEMYRQVQDQNMMLLDSYTSKDRITNQRKLLDYSFYSEE